MTLSLVDVRGPGVAADLLAGERGAERLCHLVQRRDQPVALTAVLDALADGEDVFVVGSEKIVDHEAALDLETRVLRERGVRSDTDCHDDEVGRQGTSVLETHRRHLAVAENGVGVRAGQNLDAALFDRLLQQIRGIGIELTLHQRRHQMNDRRLHAVGRKTGGRFESEQTAADDHRVAALPGGRQHRVDVVEVAERDDAGKLGAGNREQDRPGAGRDDQMIVWLDSAGLRAHASRRAIDGDDGFAFAQINVVPRIPGVVVNDDVVELLVAREYGRQHDAVVVDAGFGAEDRDVIAVRRAGEEFVQHATGGHSVAEDDKFAVWEIPIRGSFVFLFSNRADRKQEFASHSGWELRRATKRPQARGHFAHCS